MSGARLVLDGIAKRWPDGSVALDDVTLDVPAGSTLAVLGSSGAGKSTLLRLVAGLERADAGTIRLGERTLRDDATHVAPEARGVGMVFQALELWPHMTVAEHIAFGLSGRPRGRKAREHPDVRRLARDVGLDGALLGRRPDTLSGGEQQRVAIARTLAPRPGVILYDEPLANLDPDRRATIRALIRRLARDHGTTLVYVTHDPQEALELGDAVAVFDGGRLVEHGVPVDVYRRPTTLLGARAMGPVTVLPADALDGTATTVLGTHPVDRPDGAWLALWRPEDVRAAPDGPIRGAVRDVVPQGADWGFTADVAGHAVVGRSDQPLEPGAEIGLVVDAPAGLVAATETA